MDAATLIHTAFHAICDARGYAKEDRSILIFQAGEAQDWLRQIADGDVGLCVNMGSDDQWTVCLNDR